MNDQNGIEGRSSEKWWLEWGAALEDARSDSGVNE